MVDMLDRRSTCKPVEIDVVAESEAATEASVAPVDDDPAPARKRPASALAHMKRPAGSHATMKKPAADGPAIHSRGIREEQTRDQFVAWIVVGGAQNTKPFSSTARSGRLNQWQAHGWLLVANDQSRAGLRRVCRLGNAVGSCEVILGRSLHRCNFGCVAFMGRPSHATLTLHLRLLHATWPGIKRTIAVSTCSACALCMCQFAALALYTFQCQLRSFGLLCSACALVVVAALALWSVMHVCD